MTNILSSSKIQTTKFSTASCLDHSCSLETIASLDPTNNSSLGTTENSSLDPTNKSNLDPTSSSLAHTTIKNTSSSIEVTEDYAEVFNELNKFSVKVDAIGLE